MWLYRCFGEKGVHAEMIPKEISVFPEIFGMRNLSPQKASPKGTGPALLEGAELAACGLHLVMPFGQCV